jgi:hypothetical protein
MISNNLYEIDKRAWRILENQERTHGEDSVLEYCEQMMNYAGSLIGPLQLHELTAFYTFDEYRSKCLEAEMSRFEA